MSDAFASGRKAWGICDRCGMRFRLVSLKPETVAGVQLDNRVCKSCFDKDHPQLMQGKTPVLDPQALRNPRPDVPEA